MKIKELCDDYEAVSARGPDWHDYRTGNRDAIEAYVRMLMERVGSGIRPPSMAANPRDTGELAYFSAWLALRGGW